MTLTSTKKSLLREQRRLREYRLKQERLKLRKENNQILQHLRIFRRIFNGKRNWPKREKNPSTIRSDWIEVVVHVNLSSNKMYTS